MVIVMPRILMMIIRNKMKILINITTYIEVVASKLASNTHKP